MPAQSSISPISSSALPETRDTLLSLSSSALAFASRLEAERGVRPLSGVTNEDEREGCWRRHTERIA